jgi:hypothetical protein
MNDSVRDVQEVREVQSIRVPGTVFVPCPANGFKGVVSVARRCGGGCEHFGGFVEVQAAGEFSSRYRVHCKHWIARRMTDIEID